MRMCLLIALFLATLAFPRPAAAYFVATCNGVPVEWSNLIPQFRGNAFAGADPAGQFETGIAIFNSNPTNMSYWPNVDYDTDYVMGIGNGHTEVWPLLDADQFNNDDFAAVGYFTLDGCSIVEGDVIFNLAYDWKPASAKTDYNAYGDNEDDISSIPAAVHELGHTVGFGHDCSTYNVMGDAYRHFWANGPDAGSYLGEGLSDGLIDIYGDNPPPVLQAPDVGATHWRYASCNQPYSVHQRTVIRDTGGDVLDTVPGEVEPRFIAAAGQTIEAEFTFENLGNTLEEGVEVGFYFSADDTITTMDQRIGGTSFDFTRNDPDTRLVTMNLPPDLPQGDGYIGVIVDETDDISESFEANNASYIGMRIDGVDLDGDGEPDDGTETFYQYAAKVVCGPQEDPADMRLRPGIFATTVNILNPGNETVRFRKRLAVSYPPVEQVQGESFDFGFDSLDSLHALKTDCGDLAERAYGGAPPSGWFEGFVVITSPASLDVTAVYSSTAGSAETMQDADDNGSLSDKRHSKRLCRGGWGCGCCCCGGHGDDGNGDPGEGSGGDALTMDVEQIKERVIEGTPDDGEGTADLLPLRPFDGDGSQLGDNGYCIANPNNPLGQHLRIRVIIRNQGDADAAPSVTRVRFGRNGNPLPPELSTATANTPALAAGGETSHEFQIPTACYGPTGQATNCFFEVMADAAMPEDVAESNEANNDDSSQCFSPHVEG